MKQSIPSYVAKKKNIYLPRVQNLKLHNFTTKLGLKARRIFMPLVYKLMKRYSKYNVNLEYYPKLPKNENYIFVFNHGFYDDVELAMSCLDRNAYLLVGSLDQPAYNPDFYGVFINGMIVMDILDNKKNKINDELDDRELAYRKMKETLKYNSVILAPEGSWNTSYNKIVNPLYYGPYKLSKETGCKVIACSVHKSADEKDAYVRYSDPIDFGSMSKEDGTNYLRDVMATMKYEQMLKYDKPVKRSELSLNAKAEFYDSFKNELIKGKWGIGNWEAEFLKLKTDKEKFEEDYIKVLDKVKINSKNAKIFAKDLNLKEEKRKDDFVEYLYDNLYFKRKIK